MADRRGSVFVGLFQLLACALPLVAGQDKWTKVDFINYINTLPKDALRFMPYYDENNVNHEPTKILVDMQIHSFDSINEAKMEFTVDVSMHFTWINKALIPHTRQPSWEFMDIDAQNMEKIWVPDIYFPNEKKAAIHNVMMSNKMLRVYNDHTFSYIVRVSLTLGCMMDLQKYPFDRQVCSILLESFSFTADKLHLEWDNTIDDPVATNNKQELRQFRMLNQEIDAFIRPHLITGNHSCLKVNFNLARNTGYYVIQMYVPSFLIVMLSWLSFWLNVSSIPGRVTLGVLSVLTISTQSSSVNASLPRVSYTKAVDVWMATCLVFVFAALIEFAVVNVMSSNVPGRRFSLATLFQVDDKEDKEKDDEDSEESEKDTVVDKDGHVTLEPNNTSKPKKNKIVLYSAYLDIASRFMFPLAFGIFNIVYWTYYLYSTELY